MFPLFLILTVALSVILIAACGLYLKFYKSKINMALNGTPVKALPAPLHIAVIFLIVFLICMVLVSFIGGFGLAYRSFENEEGQIDVTAFYAEIVNIDESHITVEGIPLNEKNYLGKFTFELHESVIVEWHGQRITPAELQKGDPITVILVTDVVGVEDIFKIQLLKD
jgi:hypothetical protein